MTGLVERLRQRLSDLEALALATHDSDGEGEWWTPENLGGRFDEADTAFIADVDPAHVLRTIQAHREVLERYETAVVSRDAADGTLLAGATRLNLRIHEETLRLIAAIYLPDIETGDTPNG